MKPTKILYSALALFFGLMTLTSCEKEKEEVKAPQNLTLSSEKIEVTCNGGQQSVSYRVENPIEGTTATAKCENDWVKDFKVTEDAISFFVAENNTFESRQARIQVSYPQISESKVIEVVQAGTIAKPEIQLEKDRIEFTKDGGAGQIKYTIVNPVEGKNVQVKCEDFWLGELTAEKGVITFNVYKNAIPESRETTVSVSYEGAEKDASFVVFQEEGPKPPVLSIDNDHFDIAGEGGTGIVNYTIANPVEKIHPTFKCDDNWVELKLEETSKENGTISFNIPKSPLTTERQSTVTVSYHGSESVSFTITQAPKPKEPEIGDKVLTFNVGDVSFNMIYVETGSFSMGGTEEQGDDVSYNEKPVHKVILSHYYIGEFEVTQQLWEAVMESNPSSETDPSLPVNQVNYTDACTFAEKLSELTGKTFALPTEAQWEFAARGGNESKGFKYSGSNNIDEVAWYADNSDSKIHPVGEKLPNELGIFDMSGNVHEWCSDFSSEEYPSDEQQDPKGPEYGYMNVFRGGAFDLEAKTCRVSARDYYYSFMGDADYGLRIVLVL